MNEFRADLHCHTTCSDGSKTPEELLNIAKAIGLKGLSITDHDSIEAYPIAIPLARKLDIEIVTGVEFSTVHKYESVHILGYSFPPDSQIIKDFCHKHELRRNDRNQAILNNLAANGMPITENDIIESFYSASSKIKRTIGRPHIAAAMVKKGFVSSIQDAFKKYLGEGKCCYAPGESFSTEETINIIHEAKGLAVIAHPHLIEDIATLRDLLGMNFDGIECYYARFPEAKHLRWLKVARKKNWLITGGSDYHGDVKPNISLGCSFVDEPTFRVLQNHYKNNLT